MHGRPGKWYWLMLLVLTCLLLLYAEERNMLGLLSEYRQSQHQTSEIRAELRRVQDEAERLERRVHQLDSDPVEMEAAIRRNKNVVREGETIYRVELPDE